MAFAPALYARHVKGGHIEYKYNGPGTASGTSNYTFTITVFFSCTTTGPKDNVYLGVFNASTNVSVYNQLIVVSSVKVITKTSTNPCMSNPPTICYEVRTYVVTADIPDSPSGYILAVQDALRIDNIVNITNSGSSGITMTATMPGTINNVDYHTNSSPNFLFRDTAIVCYQGHFSYQFEAVDPDGDSLSYSFGDGLNVANPSGSTSSNPPASPPYSPLTYVAPFSGLTPLGSGVTIDAKTGLISGMAPSTVGEYVVAVYVMEWRKGVMIASVKKELQIYVFNCSLVAAALKSSYINCDNYTFAFQNESTSSSITSYNWDFGVGSSKSDTSTLPTPTYTYPDTGVFDLKLKVGTANGCVDSAQAPVKVYPGFTPAFSVNGSCYQSPFIFTDKTFAAYGTGNSWTWDFGDPNSTTDTSTKKDPVYQYSRPDSVKVLLLVTSTKGCADTVSRILAVSGRPDIFLPFTDTLICSIDSLPLTAQSNSGSNFSWSPNYNIVNPNTPNPVVYPKDTTTYTVVVQDKGCIDSAKVRVNVLDFITIILPADTTICKTDSIILRPQSYGLSYQWSPGSGLDKTNIKYPEASPTSDTYYTVVANLGKCQASASEWVRVVPYPVANAGIDTAICFLGTATLHGSIKGAAFFWLPVTGMSNGNTLSPSVSPLGTTNYTLTVTDTLGCPKPVVDNVVVTVLPAIKLSAGNDTSVVLGQPLQLHAISSDSANLSFSWYPSTWLNNSQVTNPVATITDKSVDSILYVIKASDAKGCQATDDIRVIVYKTAPDIMMPNAFSPNDDGRNDVIRPVLIGISRLDYFKVFNRWGQQVFSTTEANKGWDGRISGVMQDASTYVFMVQGRDYTGKVIAKKGSFVLLH